MRKSSLVAMVLFAALSVAGCTEAPLPNQDGQVNDMRDAIAIAIDEGDEARVKQLIEGEPLLINEPIPNLNNRAPLHCAAKAANATLVSYLLEVGADPYVTDDEGQTPYDVALGAGAGDDVLQLLQVR